MSYKTYRFDGKDWIGISGEIELTLPIGTRPMHPALSKKLYDQNMQSYTRHKKPSVWWLIPLNAIDVKVTTINKYTIVELTHNNKHYHGLASRADCDKDNVVTGIAVAYHRAFEKMMQNMNSGVATHNIKNKDEMYDGLLCKKLKEIWGTKKFDNTQHNLKSHLKSIAKERSEFP